MVIVFSLWLNYQHLFARSSSSSGSISAIWWPDTPVLCASAGFGKYLLLQEWSLYQLGFLQIERWLWP
jgi:hypothetical protein